MRTNIILDDQLLAEAQHLTGIKTKKGIVEEGLKLIVQVKRQETLKAWRGKLLWDDDLDTMRTDR